MLSTAKWDAGLYDDKHSFVWKMAAGLLERHGLEVTYALLFHRPTPLEDGERGLRTWLEMFGSSMTGKLPVAERKRLVEEIEGQARGKLFQDGQWVLDYRRLRIVARTAGCCE